MNYKLTTLSCFVGIFNQAVITNITAILFIPLMDIYGFTYIHLGILIAINFTTQFLTDIVFSGVIDRVGYKKLILPSSILSFVGLILFGISPFIFKDIFLGLVISTVLFSGASGLLEVLISPIVDGIPSENKGKSMALMHSFYAWGQVATIIITTLFIFCFGKQNWFIIMLVWSIVPFINFFMLLKCPYPETIKQQNQTKGRTLFRSSFYIFALLAIFFGASTEVVINQYTSTFIEKGLSMPKLVGDLVGMCGFAIMLGLGRTLYGKYGEKFKINKVLIWGALLSLICYLVISISNISIINITACVLAGFFTSLLWPGTLVISSKKFPLGGAWLFAILAAAGDLGAAFGPWVTGFVSDIFKNPEMGIKMGILTAAIFPLLCFFCHLILYKKSKKAQ